MAKIVKANWIEQGANESLLDFMQRGIEELNARLKKTAELPDGKYKGAIISIPHADSAAYYEVVSLRPVVLAHIPAGDAWHSPYAELFTASAIKKDVDASKAWRNF